MGSVEIEQVTEVEAEDLRGLYASVGWEAYAADPAALARAIANSSCVFVARSSGQLIGLARGLTDDVSVFYLQDILVRPDWQHQGIGKEMLARCLQRYAHVRQKVLLTDDLPAQHRFYEAMGYHDTQRLNRVKLHTFVQIEGLELDSGQT